MIEINAAIFSKIHSIFKFELFIFIRLFRSLLIEYAHPLKKLKQCSILQYSGHIPALTTCTFFSQSMPLCHFILQIELVCRWQRTVCVKDLTQHYQHFSDLKYLGYLSFNCFLKSLSVYDKEGQKDRISIGYWMRPVRVESNN